MNNSSSRYLLTPKGCDKINLNMTDQIPRALHTRCIQPLSIGLVLLVALSCTALASSDTPQAAKSTKTDKSYSWFTSDNLRFSGFIEAYASTDLHKDVHTEHLKSFFNRIRAEAKYTFADPKASSLAVLQKDDPYLLVSAESDFLWFGKDSDYSDYDLDLYETYFHWSSGPWQLRLGKQIVRWGKTDQLSPVDNLNPEDFRRFLLDDLEDRKIPNWMGRLRFFGDQMTLEGVFIPFFEPHDIDYFGTDWAVYRHAKQDILHLPLPAELKGFVQELHVDEDDPPNTLENSQAGVRVSSTLGDIDLAASYLHAWDPMPFFQDFPIKNIEANGPLSREDIGRNPNSLTLAPGDIDVTYRRSHIYGLEFEAVFQELGLRGESAFFDGQTFLTNNLTSTQAPVLHTVLGVDYSGENGLYANFQLSDQEIFDYDQDILFFKRHNISASGELRKEWSRGTWESAIRAVYFLTDQSSHIHPKLSYKPFAPLQLTLGLHIFTGDKDTVLGQYDDNDEAYIRMKYFF